ncbi:type II secretion system protein GspM [Piscinibacter sp.]|uniref:type II secretion system protein GspM n=1 Tax=Piscinibacter sp. TaxID=1903157 RepID=UPI002D052738|nr:type II secretion system protein GspM [Albitalea sp.]HUG21986.1 type II secretion system protein GspM [Albitalea sp.]
MKAAWTRLSARYSALARRERALVMGAGLVLILGLGSLLLIEPALKQGTLLQRQIDRQRADLQALQPQVAALALRQRDPDAATRVQLEALRRQLSLADGEFNQLQRALVSPQEMGRVLEGLLQSHRGLRLIGLRSAPVTSVTELMNPVNDAAPAPAAGQTPAAEPRDAWLYRHGVEITLQGSYADMLAYLNTLEQLPRRMYWGELKIDAQRWPANVMTVTVYTISLEKTWWRV